jgi:hypothetical protein
METSPLEKFACPRRADAPEGEALDYWRAGGERWNINGARWPESSNMPRVCSYCGGVHPGDAIALLADGWSLGLSEQHYKFYMQPDSGEADPLPPLKLYLMHFSQTEVLRADDVIRARRAFMTATHSHDDLTN